MKRAPLSLALTLLLPSLASAAPQPQVRRAEVAAPAAAANLPAVGSLGAKEQGILKKLNGMSSGQIAELLEAYARMGNRRMTAHLSQELLRRDPRNTRSRELADSLLQDATSTPDDPAARSAEEFMARRKPADAARVLTKLKNSRYPGRVFPWQEDLAYALYEAGQTAAAKACFEEILTTPGYPEAARAEARKAVGMILTDVLTKAGDAALSRKESKEAMKLAEQLLAANPSDPDAVALKAGAWSAAGQPRKAVDYLLSLKGSATGLFPHQMALAAAYQDARMFDAARAAYQVFLTHPAATAGDRAEAAARIKDLERDARLIAGDHALRTGQLARAESILTELEAAGPGQPEVAAFRAALQMKRRQYGNARDTLTKLRDQSVARKIPFESRDDLAEALAATGSPREAAAEYALVKDDPAYDKLSRFEAARRTMELNGRYRPTLSQEMEVSNEVEGTRVGATNEISTGEVAGTPNVFMLRTAWDTVDLDKSRLLRMKESERYQVEVAWRRNMKQGFFGEISAGGSNREAVYGAAIGRYPQPGAASWELSFRGNDRAMDSLPLVALDGRQNQIAFTIQKDITDRLSLDAGIRYRWVDVRGQNLGDGVNVNLNATYTLITETVSRPELTLAYIGEIQRFARNSFGQDFGNRMLQRVYRSEFSGRDLADNIIEERINRHGLILTLAKKFSPRFSGYIYGGVAREFEYGDNEGLAGAGLEAFVGPRTSLFLNVDYTTSGRAGSRGSEVWSATTGAKISF
ncbi:MAG: hypothetical protein JWL81_1107 [Verrucomicrobiales bacterium]|nr:hypothetical protein [Verrucomicrobiales bacterium]